jgi:hypothetical protein
VVKVEQTQSEITFALQEAEAAHPYPIQSQTHFPFTGRGEIIGEVERTVQRFAFFISLYLRLLLVIHTLHTPGVAGAD